MKQTIQNIIKQAIDIHLHIGPECIPRKYTVSTLIKSEQEKLGGCVLKNHFYPTFPFIQESETKKMELFGGIVLNKALGGLNTEVIYASSLLSNKPLMVWFPTIHAENFLKQSMYEIAPEWVQKKGFKARKAQDVAGVPISRNGKLVKEAISVLKTIKDTKSVLATGHISWKESVLLVNQAIQMGIEKIVITHPIYQRIAMPIEIQKELSKKGCFIEQSYSMYSIDKIPIKEIAQQIKEVGYTYVVLSSDVGQTFSPSPSKALSFFANLLQKEGITENELFTMLVKNPRKLLGIDK